MNELAMVLNVNEDDHRPAFVAGLEDVDVQDVIRTRACILTNKPFPFLTFRSNRVTHPVSTSEKEILHHIFHSEQLTCRVVKIFYIRPATGKSYSGLARRLLAKEADAIAPSEDSTTAGTSHRLPVILEDEDRTIAGTSRKTPLVLEDEAHSSTMVDREKSSTRKRPARHESPELEILDNLPEWIAPRSVKRRKITFGDAFCGAGGASQGALEAGFAVSSAFDLAPTALKSYGRNHPGARTYRMNAHDFAHKNSSNKFWKADVLHLSPPCCYWSPAQ